MLEGMEGLRQETELQKVKNAAAALRHQIEALSAHDKAIAAKVLDPMLTLIAAVQSL